MQHVFVYGSLLFNEMPDGLCGRKIKTQKAVLKDYRRFLVGGADYPAIIKEQKAEVNGKLLLNLQQNELEILSFYEGDEYNMQQVEVETDKGKVTAFAFIWIAGPEYLEETDWNINLFKMESLEYYLTKIIPETIKAFNA